MKYLMMIMKRRNYESDFVARMVLPQGMECADFVAEFSTGGLPKYRVSRLAGVLTNCIEQEEESVLAVFKNHCLGVGLLRMKLISFIPNNAMPDDIQKLVTSKIQDVELVSGAGDDCGEIEFDISVDYAVIDAYDMAVKAGYRGTREDYIKMISSKPKSSAGNVLHRKCISYNSPTGEIYSGRLLRIRNVKIGEQYGVVGLGDFSCPGYDIANEVLTVKEGNSSLLIDLLNDRNSLVKWNERRELVFGNFQHVAKRLDCPILFDDVKLEEGIVNDVMVCDKPIKVVRNLSKGVDVEIWKPMRRTKHADNGRHSVKNLQWVKVRKSGTAYSTFNYRKLGVAFLIRARRRNANRTAFGDWHYFHVRDFGVKIGSRWVGVSSNLRVGTLAKEITEVGDRLSEKVNKNDGVLHIVVSAPTSVTLDGGVVDLSSVGEHKIGCSRTSVLSRIGGDVIGIYRFDGIIKCSLSSRSDIVFVNNSTIKVNNMVWFYGCTNLVQMINTMVVVDTSDLYGLFRATHLSEMPIIVPTIAITKVGSMFEKCKNLKSIPFFDTSKCTSFQSFCNEASSLTAIPLYDTSQASSIQNMLTGTAIEALPKFDFGKVDNITTAFGLMDRLKEFPNYFNFAKVVTATYAFCGDWGYYNEQQDTYQVGALRRFPAYSLPLCTDLQGAWQDQSRLFSIGRLNIPNCTKMDTAFHGCFNLTNVRGFTGLKCNINMSHCNKLTVASMVNIFNEAANVTMLGVRTMTLGAVNLAKLSDAQKAVATAKGWTLS